MSTPMTRPSNKFDSTVWRHVPMRESVDQRSYYERISDGATVRQQFPALGGGWAAVMPDGSEIMEGLAPRKFDTAGLGRAFLMEQCPPHPVDEAHLAEVAVAAAAAALEAGRAQVVALQAAHVEAEARLAHLRGQASEAEADAEGKRRMTA